MVYRLPKLLREVKILPTFFLSIIFAGITLVSVGVYLNFRKTILSFNLLVTCIHLPKRIRMFPLPANIFYSLSSVWIRVY